MCTPLRAVTFFQLPYRHLLRWPGCGGHGGWLGIEFESDRARVWATLYGACVQSSTNSNK